MHDPLRRLPARLVLLLLVSGIAPMGADGKFYGSGSSPHLPYQRTVIVHVDGSETLVLQSRWRFLDHSMVRQVAWVVPVPAVPEIGSVPAAEASALFAELDRTTRPRVVHLHTPIAFGVLCLCLVLVLVLSVQRYRRDTVAMANAWRLAAVAVLLAGLYIMLIPTIATIRTKGNIDLLLTQQVGAYEVSVVRAATAADLTSWLADRGYDFGADDTAACADYVARGWCFVTAHLTDPVLPADAPPETEPTFDTWGMVDPLILRFPSQEPVYPLALTGTGTGETELSIYLFTAERQQPIGDLPLELSYAVSGHDVKGLDDLLSEHEDAAHLAGFPNRPFYLHAWRGLLEPAQMSDDLLFTRAKDQSDFHRRVYR